MFSPLEQFEILPLFVIRYGHYLDFTLTNQTVFVFLTLSFLVIFFNSILKDSDKTLFIIPTRWQYFFEIFYNLILAMVVDNIASKNSKKFFPLIFSVFLFIACLNLIGLVPYSFTVTSHFIVTLTLSLTVFIGINIIGFETHKLKLFALFLPTGTPLPLAFLLVPVEFILYLFRPLSLAIRLFCNMMAGHTLLKIFAGFAYSLMSISGIFFFFHYIPLITLIPLMGLEFGVALVQAFVFSLLSCIYLNDTINLH